MMPRMILRMMTPGVAMLALVPAIAQDAASPPEIVLPAVTTTIVPGTGAIPQPSAPLPDKAARAGDVTLNFPGVDAAQVATAVFGDILKLPYSVDAEVHTAVNVVTDRPIARSSVLPFLEGAFRAANLAIVNNSGTYVVTTVEKARVATGLVGAQNSGFGNEAFTLKFVSAETLKKVMESILPGLAVQVDKDRNVLTVAGTTGQRRAARDLVERFDVNWLRNMSFALYVPQRTDARLIVPELEKLIDGPGAPTAGLVKLIAMDRLNGVLAVSSQPQYLEDVRRWVEILDREGQNSEPRLFVYRVQNGRSSDLARTLMTAFGMGGQAGGAGGGQSDQAVFGQGFSRQGSDRGGTARTQSAQSVPTGSPLSSANGTSLNKVGQADSANGAQGSAGMPAAGDGNGFAGGMTITSDEANNAVVVFTTPQKYAVVEDALRKLDLAPMQVMIEVVIAEITLNDELRYGVQWLFKDRGNDAVLTESKTDLLPSRVIPGLSLGYSNGGSIQATLNALEGLTKVNVISSPKLLVINNQTASLQVGDEVPVSSASAVGIENPNAPIVNQIEYRDTGVILKVTPRVNSGGLVLLDISQEVSDVATTDTSNIDSPTISTRRIASSIAVADNQTIALGGLIRAVRTKGNSGIPLLSRIPFLGALFGTKTNNERRTELLVLLRPRVIRNQDEGQAITDELKQKIQVLTPGVPGTDF